MFPYLLHCIVLQLFLLSNAQHYLTVDPVNPVVSIGASIQLNCSINCPLGQVAWKGLDIYVDNQYTAFGYSVQTLENITISMEGRKFCEGTCSRKSYHKSVDLYVYALPKTLLLSKSMKNGIHYLNCSMEHVYPLPNINCYRESEMLHEVHDSNEDQDEDNLFNVTWSWVIPEEDWLAETSYRCEAHVLVNGQTLTREGTLKISKQVKTTNVVPASSTSHVTYTPSWKSEASYVTSNVTASQNPETTQWGQKNATTGSPQSTIPYTVTTESTPTIQDALMWTLAPVSGLLGSLLLSLQIYRQLRKKGFFQPNQMEFSTVKKDTNSQGSLPSVFCHDNLTKKEFSMY